MQDMTLPTTALVQAAGPDAPLVAQRSPVAVYLATLAPSSADTMGDHLNRIARMFGYASPDAVPWATLKPGDIAAMRKALVAKGFSYRTVNVYRAAVLGVLKACWLEGTMTRDALELCRSIRPVAGSREPAGRMLTDEEVGRLFVVAQRQRPTKAARDSAMLALLICGLRISEPIRIGVADVRPSLDDPQEVLVRGKRNKERLVPLPPGARALLVAWIALRRKYLPDRGPLLTKIMYRDEPTEEAIAVSGATQTVVRFFAAADIGDAGTHDFRRTMISKLFDKGIDAPTIQKLVGHAHVDTTARYDRRGHKALVAAAQAIHIPIQGAA